MIRKTHPRPSPYPYIWRLIPKGFNKGHSPDALTGCCPSSTNAIPEGGGGGVEGDGGWGAETASATWHIQHEVWFDGQKIPGGGLAGFWTAEKCILGGGVP